MIEIILKEKVEEKKMDALLQFLKYLKIETIVTNEILFEERTKVDFSLSAGIWEGYSIGGNQLRKQSWNIM